MLEEIFCPVDDFCQEFSARAHKTALTSDKKIRNRNGYLYPSEVITILLLFHHSGYRTFKHFYLREVCCGCLQTAFTRAPSYSRFVSWIPRVTPILFAFLHSKKTSSQGVHFMDSTPIAVCKLKRIRSHKVFRGLAAIGKTTLGWFYGFKLHCVCDAQGNLCNFFITPGNTHDIEPVKRITQKISGKIYADKAYICKQLFQELLGKGLQLVTSLRSNMKNRLINLQDKILLRKRSLIETLFGKMKQVFQIQHTRHRSPINGLANICAALVAYILSPNKPKIKLKPENMRFLKKST